MCGRQAQNTQLCRRASNGRVCVLIVILQRVWQLCILRSSVAPLPSSSYVTGAIDPAVLDLPLSNLVCLQPEAVQNCTAFL